MINTQNTAKPRYAELAVVINPSLPTIADWDIYKNSSKTTTTYKKLAADNIFGRKLQDVSLTSKNNMFEICKFAT